MNRRRVPFDTLPAALKAAMARDCALIVHCDLIDEVRYDIFETRREGTDVVISRRCWWFDDETTKWVLDESSDWFLTSEQAMQLGMSIQQVSMPPLARTSTG